MLQALFSRKLSQAQFWFRSWNHNNNQNESTPSSDLTSEQVRTASRVESEEEDSNGRGQNLKALIGISIPDTRVQNLQLYFTFKMSPLRIAEEEEEDNEVERDRYLINLARSRDAESWWDVLKIKYPPFPSTLIKLSTHPSSQSDRK